MPLLGNLGNLAKPATVLIEKVSDAVGGIFRPFQIVRVAKAQAEAERIQAESQIQVNDLHRRAINRFLEEEAKKQSNIESITQKAFPHLGKDSSPQDVEDDWIINFFDKCRIVSDDSMQQLWAQILAGEANSPGKFDRKTVNLLADLEQIDAELFTLLCGYCWVINNSIVLLFYNLGNNIYNIFTSHSINLVHLENLGFISNNFNGEFQSSILPEKIMASYFGRHLELTFPKATENRLSYGNVSLSRAGLQLASVCESKPVDGFFEFVCDKWASESLVLKIEPNKS
jgi:hypothetical protein